MSPVRGPLRGLLLFTASGIAAYWVAVFAGVFPVEELMPGYRNWFLSFPLADGWIAAAAILAVAVSSSDRSLSAILVVATGSGLIFLGLYAFTYGFNTGLVFHLTVNEGIEIAIKIYCLGVGAWFVASGYRQTLEHGRTEVDPGPGTRDRRS